MSPVPHPIISNGFPILDPDHDPEGIPSILDTDLYKLTMQCAVINSGWGGVDVTYSFTNRTPDLKVTKEGFEWLGIQIGRLGHLSLTEDEYRFLKETCTYLPESYLEHLKIFRFKPEKHVGLQFIPLKENGDLGDIYITIAGTWAETILYEIPLLVLVSECYFRFTDTDWNYDGQIGKAYDKGMVLLRNGCMFSEFGTRRRRSYKTQELVLEGLIRAQKDFEKLVDGDGVERKGRLVGTSNVHFAHKYNLTPIGTVAHEWFMGIAAITGDYRSANLIGLQKWVETFGPGVLGVALTDTFGTEQFLKCFRQVHEGTGKMYAEIYTGVRQDSGDPKEYVRLLKNFCEEMGIEKQRKTIIFSDSLNVELCLKYKEYAESSGFGVSFGVGTYLTNDFVLASKVPQKSIPMNIVIKLSSAAGNPAVKISDNIGKNTGDRETVEKVKGELGYTEKSWAAGGKVLGDERFRWGNGIGTEVS